MPVKKLQIIVLHESDIFDPARAATFSTKLDPFINNPDFLSIQFAFMGVDFVAIVVLQTVV